MKLTPFTIFLIILFILVIFTVVSNYIKANGKEGFISFGYNATPTTQQIQPFVIPLYSINNQVNQIYDTVFIDQTNGNLIDVDSPAYAGTVDSNGSTITTINTITRDGTPNIHNSSASNSFISPESMLTDITCSYGSWMYSSTMSVNTDKYAVVYIPWNKDTYIQMLNTTQKTNVGVWHSSPPSVSASSQIDQKLYQTKTMIGLTGYIEGKSSLNSDMVNDNIYGKQLYQISANVKYDIANGYLVIQTGSEKSRSITYYDRTFKSYGPFTSSNQVTGLPTTVTNVNFNAYNVVDIDEQYLVTYIVNGTNTIITLISYTDNTKTAIKLANVCRFTSSGVDRGNCSPTADNSGWSPIISPVEGGYVTGNVISSGGGRDMYKYNAGIFDPTNYVLKTQVVPPVCPACPACPTDKLMCTNCGGHGGSGTLSKDGSIVAGNHPLIDATGKIISGAEVGAGKIIGGAEDALGDLASGAGSVIGGAENIVGGALYGAGSAIGGVASGAGSAIGGVASGIGSAIGGAGQDQDKGSRDRSTQLLNYGNVPMIMGTQNQYSDQYSDQYSYYGKVPAKQSSNYMPVTADFSAFSK